MKQRFWNMLVVLMLLLPLIAACGTDEATEVPVESTEVAVDTGAETNTEEPAVEATEEPNTDNPTVAPADEGGNYGDAAIVQDSPPPVTNADAARQYEGTTITYYGDSVGLGAELDQILAEQFTADTGIQVEVIPKPQDATENYATYQRFFQGQSADIDVMMLDVIWPGAFAQHLYDLGPALGEEAQAHAQGIVQNNTVDGKLVAMPWFGDYGMLYYRTDLLEKYGFDGPPETWDELTEMAQTIQDGEKAENANFTGFVWQGAAYEGLTCDALEWQASSGGGFIVDEDGNVTVNNPETARALNRARDWVGTISPEGVTSYKEEDARNAFQSGNAAFMRNWPYAYALGNQPDESGTLPPIADKFDVAPLPHEAGSESVGTVGGWQLGVSAYSQNPEAAVEFVRYMTSPDVQLYRGVVGGYVPTVLSVLENEQVIAAQPYLSKPEVANVVRAARPAAAAGENYNQFSTVYFQGVNQILLGANAEDVLPQVEQQLQRLLP